MNIKMSYLYGVWRAAFHVEVRLGESSEDLDNTAIIGALQINY